MLAECLQRRLLALVTNPTQSNTLQMVEQPLDAPPQAQQDVKMK